MDSAQFMDVGLEGQVTAPVVRPQDALLSHMELNLTRNFFPLGYTVEFATNHQEVFAAAEESFGHLGSIRKSPSLRISLGVSEGQALACPPEPTRREYRHLYSLVADPENQALLDLKTCTSFAWLTKATVAHRLYFRQNFLEKIVYLLLGATFVTDLHAGCVGKDGKGILLCGESGAGKSTLAYACARAGWTYTSDDTSYLINDSDFPRVIGHAHRVRFRPAAKNIFPELEAFNITPRMEGKPSIEVPLSILPVRNSAIECDVHAVVYLKRYPNASGSLIRQPVGTATRRTRSELYSAGEIRARHEKILEKLWDVPAYELHYSALNTGLEMLDCLVSSL